MWRHQRQTTTAWKGNSQRRWRCFTLPKRRCSPCVTTLINRERRCAVWRAMHGTSDVSWTSEAKLRKSADSRQAIETQFAERLRLSSAALKSSRAQVEASQLKCLQATSLSTALQERVDELEDQITTLKSSRNHPPTTVINAYPSLRTADEASRLPHTQGQASSLIAIGEFHLQSFILLSLTSPRINRQHFRSQASGCANENLRALRI